MCYITNIITSCEVFDLKSWPQQLLVLVAAFKGSFKVEVVGHVTEAVAVRAATVLALTFGVRRIHIRARDVTIAVASRHWVPLTASFKAFAFILVTRG